MPFLLDYTDRHLGHLVVGRWRVPLDLRPCGQRLWLWQSAEHERCRAEQQSEHRTGLVGAQRAGVQQKRRTKDQGTL